MTNERMGRARAASGWGTTAVLALLCWTVLAGTAGAAEWRLEGRLLRVIGPLNGEALPAIVEQLGHGQVRTVVFEDSRGGDADVAEAYGAAIRDAGVATEVKGQCSGACAYAFLAGAERRFSVGVQANSLLIPLHQAPDAATLAQLGVRPDLHASPSDATQVGNVAATLVPMDVRAAWHVDRGMLFTTRPTLFGRVYASHWCDGSQGRDLSRCENLSDVDPVRLGVISPR